MISMVFSEWGIKSVNSSTISRQGLDAGDGKKGGFKNLNYKYSRGRGIKSSVVTLAKTKFGSRSENTMKNISPWIIYCINVREMEKSGFGCIFFLHKFIASFSLSQRTHMINI